MRLLALTAALLLATATAASATTKATVRLDRLAPLVVVGAGFPHAAPVHVLVSSGQVRVAKTVRTTRAGTFRATWSRALGSGGCGGLFVLATSGTTRAIWKTMPAKNCPPSLQP